MNGSSLAESIFFFEPSVSETGNTLPQRIPSSSRRVQRRFVVREPCFVSATIHTSNSWFCGICFILGGETKRECLQTHPSPALEADSLIDVIVFRPLPKRSEAASGTGTGFFRCVFSKQSIGLLHATGSHCSLLVRSFAGRRTSSPRRRSRSGGLDQVRRAETGAADWVAVGTDGIRNRHVVMELE